MQLGIFSIVPFIGFYFQDRDMALWHISFTLPQVLAPALLAGVLHHFNAAGHNVGYRVVFGAAALWFALGTVMVSRIRGVR